MKSLFKINAVVIIVAVSMAACVAPNANTSKKPDSLNVDSDKADITKVDTVKHDTAAQATTTVKKDTVKK